MKTIQALIVTCVLGCQLQAQVSFKLSSSPGAGNGPYASTAADVNGDGKVDLICVDYYGNSLTVLTNNGSGGFVLSGTYPVGSAPTGVAAADVNGDGKVDLISANGGDSTISVLTNNGSGGFALSGTYPVGSGPTTVTAVDVNGDGKLDLITANWNSNGGNTLTVLTNNGTGGFVLASSPVVGTGPFSVTAADVNGDGNADLISANWADNTLSVLTNNGSGGFVLSGTYPVGSAPKLVTAADVNGNGKVDLICANWGGGTGNTLTVLTNNGSGGFAFSSTLNVGSGVICLAAADVNGDGKVDLISANNKDNTLSVLTNNGSGGFVLATSLNVGNSPNWVAAAGVNGDGKVDLISANGGDNTLSVLTNATPFSGYGQVSFALSSTNAVGSEPFSVVVADVNRDGNVDLISANASGNSLTVLTNNSFGQFMLSGTYPVGNTPYSVAAADVRGDGKVDLISANANDNTLTVLTNDGSGGFVPASAPSVGWHPDFVTTADVNGDGKLDLICANQYAHSLSVLTNDGSGGFVLASSPNVGNDPGWVATADVNGDGKVDLICANQTDNTLTVLTNDGSGGFVLAATLSVGNGPHAIVATNLSGDGRVDLACVNINDNTLMVLTNDGGGGFALAGTYAVGSMPFTVTAADVNRDGKVDLICANSGDNTLTVLTNNGSGGFVPATSLSVGNAPYSVTTADVNGDGKVDLICGNSGDNTLSVLLNSASSPPPVYSIPTITNQPASQSIWAGSNVTFTVGVSGTGPFHYQWLFNSNSISTNGIIVTVAGGGAGGGIDGLGDGGAATNAILNQPYGTTIDATHNLLIAEVGNNRVRKVGTNGIITTIAGNGSGGTSGDGGAATNASVTTPVSLAVDASGNLYIAASQSYRIRKVDTNGIITTVAGGGAGGGTDGLGDGGAATNASLNLPNGVTFDSSGNLFIADWGNNRVRKVNANGIITTVAGGGAGGGTDGLGDGGTATNATLNGPVGLAFDSFGNLFIGDTKNNRVRELSTNGVITTVAGGGVGGGTDGLGDGGLATNASLNNPNGVAVDAFGNLYIADSGNNRIRMMLANNGIITTVAGGGAGGGTDGLGDGGVATNSTTSAPQGVALDNLGNLFIADYGNSRIRKVAFDFNDAPTLNLNNVSTTNAGTYQVIVTSPYGSITSSLATLNILVPSRIATGTAVLANGFVVGVTVTDTGYGYTNTPQVQIIGGGGSGAAGYAVVVNGIVTSIIVTNAGSGYTNAPQVVIDPPFIFNPVLGIAPMSFLSFSNLTIGGAYQLQQLFQYYWTNLPINFTASNALYTQMVAGVAGSGNYRLALNPVPAQAFATPVVAGGFVISATVTSGGSGYVTRPAVAIVGRSVIGAGAYSSISGGVVTGITVTNAGYGYTNTVTVQIAPPPAAAVYPTVLPVMRVDSANLAAYDNYQIQFRPDIAAPWMNWGGGLFSPTAVTNSQYIFITNGVGYFRLQYVP